MKVLYFAAAALSFSLPALAHAQDAPAEKMECCEKMKAEGKPCCCRDTAEGGHPEHEGKTPATPHGGH